jgi:hypothetical protein
VTVCVTLCALIQRTCPPGLMVTLDGLKPGEVALMMLTNAESAVAPAATTTELPVIAECSVQW